MKRLLSIGLLLASGCSSTSPFATTAQKPVPLGTQIASRSSENFGQSGETQFTQNGPNSYVQGPEKPTNPFFAGVRSTAATIGDAFSIEPRVIPATAPTSLAGHPANISADLHFQAAQVYETQQNTASAITHFQKALEASPADPKIMVAFGRLYDRQNDLLRAQGLYRQALQVDPNNGAALNALGISYAKQGNLDAALTELARAAQVQPENARYKNNIANVLADAGRYDEAYAQLASVHGEAVAHYNLGYLLLQQGKQAEARRELGLALKANPYMEQARSVLDSMGPTSGQVQPASTGNGVSISNAVAPSEYPITTAHSTGTQSFEQPPLTGPRSLPPLQ